MFKGLANLANLMRQAQQMSGKMQALNEQLRSERCSAATGGGMVEVEVNGLGEVMRVKIDPALVARGDREMIEDLLPAAVNLAVEKARQRQMAGVQNLTEGLNVPGLSEALGTLNPDSKG